jgi:hypothetical protein
MKRGILHWVLFWFFGHNFCRSGASLQKCFRPPVLSLLCFHIQMGKMVNVIYLGTINSRVQLFCSHMFLPQHVIPNHSCGVARTWKSFFTGNLWPNFTSALEPWKLTVANKVIKKMEDHHGCSGWPHHPLMLQVDNMRFFLLQLTSIETKCKTKSGHI